MTERPYTARGYKTEGGNDVTSAVYSVEGMTCGHCESAISSEVGAVPGVQAVQVDLEANTVTVEAADFDDKAVRAAIDRAGYEVVT